MHSEPVLLKCNTNQVSGLLHYALENLIYFNCGLVLRPDPWTKVGGETRMSNIVSLLISHPCSALEKSVFTHERL